MKGNKILYAGIAVLILGLGFSVGTYAYYQTTVSGTASGTILAWECGAGTTSTSTFSQSLTNLKPGSQGSVSIQVKSKQAATATLTITNIQNMQTSGSAHPYLKLYRDSGYSTVLNNGESLSAVSVPAGGSTAGTITFYYKWPFGNQIDTYSDTRPVVNFTITCTQVQ